MSKPNRKWEKIGHCAVDAGMLMIGDPCYFLGGEPNYTKSWSEFVDEYRDDSKGDSWRMKHQLCFPLGHAGMGVLAGTAWGDGVYPVFAWKEEGTDRTHAMLVVTGDDVDLPPEVAKLMEEWRDE